MWLLIPKDATAEHRKKICEKAEALVQIADSLSCNLIKFGHNAHYTSKSYLGGCSLEERARCNAVYGILHCSDRVHLVLEAFWWKELVSIQLRALPNERPTSSGV